MKEKADMEGPLGPGRPTGSLITDESGGKHSLGDALGSGHAVFT